MERINDIKKQEKIAKVFKAVISAGIIAPVFVSVSACEKAKLAPWSYMKKLISSW